MLEEPVPELRPTTGQATGMVDDGEQKVRGNTLNARGRSGSVLGGGSQSPGRGAAATLEPELNASLTSFRGPASIRTPSRSALPCAETEHPAGDRFCVWNGLGAHDRLGDQAQPGDAGVLAGGDQAVLKSGQ
jgi:hypothetical protein